jgi:hypothetical protein
MLEQLGVTGRIVARQTYSDAERLRPGVLALRAVDPGDGPAAPNLQETDPRGLRDALDALARRHPHPRVLALLELANWVVNEEGERPCVPERLSLAPSLRRSLRTAEATLLQAAEGREPFETAWDLTPSTHETP